MTRTERQLKAQQVRDDYRAARLQRLQEGGLELVEPALPGNPIVDLTDGTLNKSALAQDLAVEVSPWPVLPPAPGLTATVDLLWVRAQANGEPPPVDEQTPVVDSVEVEGPGTNIIFPLQLNVPRAELAPDGKYFLITRLFNYNYQYDYSHPKQLITDSEPPYRDGRPGAIKLPDEAITEQYLEDHEDKVIGGIPEYDDYAKGDKVTWYWGKLPPPDSTEGLEPAGTAPVDGVTWPFPVEFSGDVIRAAGDGNCYALYTLTDKATNVSLLSAFAPASVVLGPFPSDLQDPEVPLAPDDDLLDLADAIEGVVVEIPEFTNHKPNDRIYVTWGETELVYQTVGANPRFPLQVWVPATALRSNYTTASGAQDTVVSYVYKRGSISSEVKSVTIAVDFSVPGPPRPDPDLDWPEPTNPALLLAEVRGAISDLENELTREDQGEDATLTFTLYDSAAVGDVISFWWDGVEVVEAEYRVQGLEGGTEISRTIPWRYILDGFNNPELPVWYQVGAEDAANYQKSPVTEVNANAVTLEPPAPTYLGLAGPFLNCDSLYADPENPGPLEPAIRVVIPDLSEAPFNLRVDDEVTLSWVLVRGYTGEELIEEAELEEVITLDATHPPTGFTWFVQPYDQHILPAFGPDPLVPDSRGRASYSFVLNGERVFSDDVEAFVSMHNGSTSCPIPPLRPEKK